MPDQDKKIKELRSWVAIMQQEQARDLETLGVLIASASRMWKQIKAMTAQIDLLEKNVGEK
jgi:hypothetical protein